MNEKPLKIHGSFADVLGIAAHYKPKKERAKAKKKATRKKKK